MTSPRQFRGDLFNEAMAGRGITGEQAMATAAGISRMTLWRLRQADVSDPKTPARTSLADMIRLARLCELSIDDLFPPTVGGAS